MARSSCTNVLTDPAHNAPIHIYKQASIRRSVKAQWDTVKFSHRTRGHAVDALENIKTND